ncbi:MAG: hypothetical protein ABIT83_17600 [Massilia sp.]
MEFHAVLEHEGTERSAKTLHVFSTTTRCGDDASPLEFISPEQLAYYRALDQAVLAFCAAIGVVGPVAPAPIE